MVCGNWKLLGLDVTVTSKTLARWKGIYIIDESPEAQPPNPSKFRLLASLRLLLIQWVQVSSVGVTFAKRFGDVEFEAVWGKYLIELETFNSWESKMNHVRGFKMYTYKASTTSEVQVIATPTPKHSSIHHQLGVLPLALAPLHHQRKHPSLIHLGQTSANGRMGIYHTLQEKQLQMDHIKIWSCTYY